jgi:capsular polysaccharide transport system ATP-binding protein
MIRLDRVSKRYRVRGGIRTVLDDVSVTFPTGRNVGILGRNGAGKSTLIRLIAGAEHPDSGRITRDVRVSWPLGFGGAFQGSMSGRDNVRFISRIYGANWREVLDAVEDFAELGPYLDMPLSTYSSGMRARLSLGLSLAIDFDCYLVDELPGVADARLRARYEEIMKTRRARSSMILVSHSPAAIKAQCDLAAILHRGQLVMTDDVGAAINLYGRL